MRGVFGVRALATLADSVELWRYRLALRVIDSRVHEPAFGRLLGQVVASQPGSAWGWRKGYYHRNNGSSRKQLYSHEKPHN